jgi:opacity protein-like surface antigen
MRITGKRCLLSAVALCGVVSAASAAFAQEDVSYGTYLSLGGGLNLTQDDTKVLRNPDISNLGVSRDVSYNTGYNITGAFGYKWLSGFRTEAEVSYRHSGIDRLNTVDWSGSQAVWGFMGNVLYDFNTASKINFSVGGGVGAGRASWNNVTAPASPNFDSHDTNLQWQLIGEVGMPLSSQIQAFVDYRYITLYDSKFTSVPPGARISAGTDHSHNILVGLRYYFNQAG